MGHLKALRALNFALGAYTFVFGLLFVAMFGLPWLIERDTTTFVVALVGVLVFLLLGGLGVAHVVVGYLVGAQRGRIAQTVLAFVQVSSFPVGTVFALYALYVCWLNDASRRAFERGIKPGIT
ncbi:MAG: hypothetical protein ACOCUS_06265 [Polyangiales bacterium]